MNEDKNNKEKKPQPGQPGQDPQAKKQDWEAAPEEEENE